MNAEIISPSEFKQISFFDNPLFNEYYNLGGIFTLDSLKKASDVFSKMDQIDEKNIPFINGTKSMVEKCGGEISLDQKKYYIALRESVTFTKDDCSDQEVFAQMLLVTGSMEKYQQFTKNYPNIFCKGSSDEIIQRLQDLRQNCQWAA